MITTGETSRRVAAGLGAVALGLTGVIVMGTAAQAVTGPAPDQPGAPTQGSLTINKYSGAHTATPDADNLLDGVEFTVTEVGRLAGGDCVALDLAESAAWDGLPDLFTSAPAAPADAFCLTNNVFTDVTAAGQATFNLPVGIYFAEETDPGNNPIISAVPNFYVSIPTSEGAAGDGWNYDVVADPKNQLAEKPVKTITDRPDVTVIGGKVTWDLTVPIPTLNADDRFTVSSVTDKLPAGLTYTGSTVSIDGIVLEAGKDYIESGNITWTFTDGSGLAALFDHQGSDMVISLETEVNTVTETGAIANSEYSSTFNNATVTGDQIPYTYWGQLKIQKNDDSIPARGLEGAQFQVFEKSAAPCAVTAPTTGAVATGTSNAAGSVEWRDSKTAATLGLWVANSKNGPADPAPTKDYCLYETVVPTGHVAQAIANPVTITPGALNVANLTVVNPKKDGPDLPLTGSTGTLAMTLGGIAIVLVGAGALLVTRRRTAGSL